MKFAASPGDLWRRFDRWLLQNQPRLWVGRLPVLLTLATILWGLVLFVVMLAHSYVDRGKMVLSHAGLDLRSAWVIFLFLSFFAGIYWIVCVQRGGRGEAVNGWSTEPRARMMLAGLLLLTLPAPVMSYFVSNIYAQGRCQLFDYDQACENLTVEQQISRIRQDYDFISKYHAFLTQASAEMYDWPGLALLRGRDFPWAGEFDFGGDENDVALFNKLQGSDYATSLATFELVTQIQPIDENGALITYDDVFIKGVSFTDELSSWSGGKRKRIGEAFLKTRKVAGTDLYQGLDTLGLQTGGLISAIYALATGFGAGDAGSARVDTLVDRFVGVADIKSRSPEFKELSQKVQALAQDVTSAAGSGAPPPPSAEPFSEADATAYRDWRQQFYDYWTGLAIEERGKLLHRLKTAMGPYLEWKSAPDFGIITQAGNEISSVKASLRELVGAIAAQNAGVLGPVVASPKTEFKKLFESFDINTSEALAPHAEHFANGAILFWLCFVVVCWVYSRHHGFGMTLLMLVLLYFTGIASLIPAAGMVTADLTSYVLVFELFLVFALLAGMLWRCSRTRRCSRSTQFMISFLLIVLAVGLSSAIFATMSSFLAATGDYPLWEAVMGAAIFGSFVAFVFLLDPIWERLRRVHALPA